MRFAVCECSRGHEFMIKLDSDIPPEDIHCPVCSIVSRVKVKWINGYE